MYLEERIEQVERHNETTARALADLTVDVRAIRRDQTEGFKEINARSEKIESRLEKIESRLEKVESRLEKVESRLEKLETDVAELKQDMGMVKQTLQLLLAYVQEKLP